MTDAEFLAEVRLLVLMASLDNNEAMQRQVACVIAGLEERGVWIDRKATPDG